MLKKVLQRRKLFNKSLPKRFVSSCDDDVSGIKEIAIEKPHEIPEKLQVKSLKLLSKESTASLVKFGFQEK